MEKDNSSFALGYLLSFLFGLIGVLIVCLLSNQGTKIRKGAAWGIISVILIFIVVFFVFSIAIYLKSLYH